MAIFNDKDLLLRHLREAREHVTKSEEHIAIQRAIIAELERDGHDTTTAKSLLATYLELQAEHELHLERLKQELAELE